MGRNRRLAMIAVPIVALVLLFLPFPTTVVPEWTIKVEDQHGKPLAGSRIRQIWQHYTYEETGHGEDRVTDQNGVVSFPRRVIVRSLFRRIISTVSSLITLIAHGSMGRDAYLMELDHGDIVSMGPLERLPDKMVVNVEH